MNTQLLPNPLPSTEITFIGELTHLELAQYRFYLWVVDYCRNDIHYINVWYNLLFAAEQGELE